jgi:hypothetical protein
MANKRLGKLLPRYSFILNQYPTERLSKCPRCEKLTHLRKFAFFIHIDGWGPLLLGQTSRYCSRCELIMLHQHELEEQLAHAFSERAPHAVGSKYLVMGTIEKKVWQTGLQGEGKPTNEMLKHLADFKKVLTLHLQPAGWYPADRKES